MDFIKKCSIRCACAFRDKVVDFHWSASDPWTVVSVSDDCESSGGGGTLQVNTSLFYPWVRKISRL